MFNHSRDPIFGKLSWGILQKLSKHEPLKSHVARLASAVHATDAVTVPISALTVALSQAAINVNERQSGGRATVACRVPDHHQARLIAEKMGRPIVSTSLNLSGKPPLRLSLIHI